MWDVSGCLRDALLRNCLTKALEPHTPAGVTGIKSLVRGIAAGFPCLQKAVGKVELSQVWGLFQECGLLDHQAHVGKFVKLGKRKTSFAKLHWPHVDGSHRPEVGPLGFSSCYWRPQYILALSARHRVGALSVERASLLPMSEHDGSPGWWWLLSLLFVPIKQWPEAHRCDRHIPLGLCWDKCLALWLRLRWVRARPHCLTEVLHSSQMMPEVRGALFGANANRKFLD